MPNGTAIQHYCGFFGITQTLCADDLDAIEADSPARQFMLTSGTNWVLTPCVARIRQFTATTTVSRAHPTEVDCGYQVVTTENGRLLQLSTYGSDSRQSAPKVSQTIQIDEDAARTLLRILRKTFPLL